MKQHVDNLISEVDELSSSLEHTGFANSTAEAPQPVPAQQPQVGENEPPPGLRSSNILCTTASNSDNSPDYIFFGLTSSFARFASSISRLPPLLEEASTLTLQPAKPYQRLLDSLVLDVTSDLPLADARDLLNTYHYSIEITLPILGQDLISKTLDSVYTEESGNGDSVVARARFASIIAISLAIHATQDPNLQIVADAYFRQAISRATSADLLVYPTDQCLQMTLLLCIYAWICPGAIDIWRLLGHASRMCLDIIEVQGSGKVDSGCSAVLYRTLYTLETRVAILFGRPSQLPDGQDLPAYAPELTSAGAGDLSTLAYNLARLQNRFQRHLLGNKLAPSRQNLGASPMTNVSWMTACVSDMKAWLGDWNAQVDALSGAPSPSRVGAEHQEPLRLCGEFQQCEALLLVRMAPEADARHLVTSEEEVAICKRLLHTMDALRLVSVSGTGKTEFMFPLTWTRAHTVFTATATLLEQLRLGLSRDPELQRCVQLGISILASSEGGSGRGTHEMVNCLRNMYESSN